MKQSEVVSRRASDSDVPAISALHARVFGPGRFARSAYRIREGAPELSRFCRVAELGSDLVAAIRMTEVSIGGQHGALLLGPIVVAPGVAGQGHGRRLIKEVLDAARTAHVVLVLLVGDEPYYGALGFKPVPPGQITLPGPVNPARLLAAELASGALAAFRGAVAARRV